MKLLWLDVETSGLNPGGDDILELAVAEADLERPFQIGPIANPVFKFTAQYKLNAWARDKHTASGLLAACDRSALTVRDYEMYLLDRFPVVDNKDNRYTIAGRGAHFDLSFIRAHMPEFAARLSYRVYDVSTIGLFCESMGMQRLPKAEAHRAQADVMESIEHARKCTEWLALRR